MKRVFLRGCGVLAGGLALVAGVIAAESQVVVANDVGGAWVVPLHERIQSFS